MFSAFCIFLVLVLFVCSCVRLSSSLFMSAACLACFSYHLYPSPPPWAAHDTAIFRFSSFNLFVHRSQDEDPLNLSTRPLKSEASISTTDQPIQRSRRPSSPWRAHLQIRYSTRSPILARATCLNSNPPGAMMRSPSTCRYCRLMIEASKSNSDQVTQRSRRPSRP